MEYLPENQNININLHVTKKEIKMKDFREYLVDKDVVLAFVKCKLAILIIFI
jgi:hypothetical protein